MLTKDRWKLLTSLSTEEHLLAIAIGTVMGRASRVSAEDRSDLLELVDAYATAEDDEERQNICVAALEILEQKKATFAPFPVESGSDSIDEWLTLVSLRIRETRTARGWNQAELAAAAGLSENHVSRLEAKQQSPSRKTLKKLAAALNLPLANFDPIGE